MSGARQGPGGWPAVGQSTAAALGARLVLEDEAGQSMTPPRARTLGPRRAHAGGPRARTGLRPGLDGGTACYKPGERSRPVYAIREHRLRKDEPKGFGWRDFRELIVRVRIQRGSPIVLVRDNARIHLVPPLKEFFEAGLHRLTVFQPSAYAPETTPDELVNAGLKRTLLPASRACNADQLADEVRRF